MTCHPSPQRAAEEDRQWQLAEAERRLDEDRRMAQERARLESANAAAEMAEFEAALKTMGQDADMLRPFRDELCVWINGACGDDMCACGDAMQSCWARASRKAPSSATLVGVCMIVRRDVPQRTGTCCASLRRTSIAPSCSAASRRGVAIVQRRPRRPPAAPAYLAWPSARAPRSSRPSHRFALFAPVICSSPHSRPRRCPSRARARCGW